MIGVPDAVQRRLQSLRVSQQWLDEHEKAAPQRE
jgi:hypothetical protein